MNDKTIRRLSKKLSWLLRHGAGTKGLPMDAAGWVPVADVLSTLRVSRGALEATVADNNKSRFQVKGERVRASQGHSRQGMPVTLDALEASWERYEGPDSIWHGTRREAVESISHKGIHSGARTHVHLACSLTSHVGKRHNVPVMLEVSCQRLRDAGHEVFVSPNGVVLTRFVPPHCIV